MTTFDDRLQAALAALESGASLEDVLADVPAHQRDELRDLLLLARAVQRVEHPRSASVNVARLIDRAQENQPSPFTRRAYALAVTALTLLVFVGLFVLRPLWQMLRDQDVANEPQTVVPTVPVAPSPTALGTPTAVFDPDVPQNILTINEAPVLRRGPAGTWDGALTEPFALVELNSLLYLYRSGNDGDGRSNAIGLSVSDNVTSFNWETPSPDPVLTLGEDAGYLLPGGSVLPQADGTWVMLLAASQEFDYFAPASIYRATAPAPEGPWTLDKTPLLEPTPRSWDSQRVYTPVLVETEDGYWLFYTGMDRDGRQAIGAATSQDGLSWTKVSDPLLSIERIPVPQDEVLTLMDAVSYESGFLMLYRVGTTLAPSGDTYGLAFSDGGSRRRLDEPWHMTGDSIRAVYDAKLRMVSPNSIDLYFGVATGAGISVNIWKATYDLPEDLTYIPWD